MRTIQRPFLTARWSHLAILTYEAPSALLEPHLPSGLHLDTRGGRAFASLVAFDFDDTRVGGVAWPGARRFPEINLRFYVSDGRRRGVVFVRELVPQPLVSWVARALYHEPYLVAPIESRVEEDASEVHVERQLLWRGRRYRIELIGTKPTARPAEDSDEHFFKEHHWGFGRSRQGRTLAYEVRHPVWDVYPVRSWSLDFDWAAVYGSAWRPLGDEKPVSVMLAVGSPVAVFPRRRL
jgi:uncharacterized protein YqjF (DUF2071 family)